MNAKGDSQNSNQNQNTKVEFKSHPTLQKLYDKYKIKGDFVKFTEIFLHQIYGQLLFSFALGLVEGDALEEFDKFLSDAKITDEHKLEMLYKLIHEHSNLNLDEFYTHLVNIFVNRLEKNLKTVVQLYNKSISVSKTPDEVEKNFLEYLKTYDEMKLNDLQKYLDNQKNKKDERR